MNGHETDAAALCAILDDLCSALPLLRTHWDNCDDATLARAYRRLLDAACTEFVAAARHGTPDVPDDSETALGWGE